MTGVPTERSPALDGVRGLALLVVVLHNTAWTGGASNQAALKLYRAAAAAGWVGVQLFFVLSGLLITNILLDTRGSPHFFRRFYLRRSLRIFPLYYTMIVFVVCIAAPLAWSPTWTESVYRHQWAFWLYVSNWTEPLVGGVRGLSHLWSLAVEEQFYMVWPALVLWLPPRRLVWLVVAMVAGAPFVRMALLHNGLPPLVAYNFTVARMDALAIGAFLALCLRDRVLRGHLRRWLAPLTAMGSTVLVLLIARQRGFHPEEPPVLILGQSLAAFLCFCLLAYTQFAGTIPGGTLVKRVFSAKVLGNLGTYSYAMYLAHTPLHALLQGVGAPVVQQDDGLWHLPRLLAYSALVLALSYATARLTWILIERPALRLKERVAPAAAGTITDALAGDSPAGR